MFSFSRVAQSFTLVALVLGGDTGWGGDDCNSELVVVPSPNPADADETVLQDVVVIAPDDIWAVGDWEINFPPPNFGGESFSLAMHFDGNDWTIVPSPSPVNAEGLSEVNPVAIDAVHSDLVYAAGAYTSENNLNTPDTFVMRWDGNSWGHIISPGQSMFGAQGFIFTSVEAINEENIWFGGQFEDPAVSDPRPTMVHYDGSNFTTYFLPFAPNSVAAHRVRAISALAEDDIWAAGSSGGSAVAVGASYVAHWDGSTWEHIPTPHPGTGEILRDVVAIAPDDVWVTGEFRIIVDNVSVAQPLFLHWNGEEWGRFESPAFANSLLAFGSDDIYGTSADHLLHWDGHAWTIIAELKDQPSDFTAFTGIDAIGHCELVLVGANLNFGDESESLIVRYQPGAVTGDLNNDGAVDGSDLGVLLGAFNTDDSASDLNNDGTVDGADLGLLLGNWSDSAIIPECGDPDTGDCCAAHDSPACDDSACCDAVCLTDDFCCQLEWDEICALKAAIEPACSSPENCEPESCGSPGDGDCCSLDNQTAGCDDAACCEAVCANDPFCCLTEWDEICANLAFETAECGCASEGCGMFSCCVIHDTPGCNDQDCCDAVCAIRPFCCNVEWDVLCTNIAFTRPECDCQGTCPPSDHSCCETGEPGCDDPECCMTVCAIDDFCCAFTWSPDCVELAKSLAECDCT